MEKDNAHDVASELRELGVNVSVEERETHHDYRRYFDIKKGGIELPSKLRPAILRIADEHGLHVILDTDENAWRDNRHELTLSNNEYDEIEKTPEEKERERLEREIRETFDFDARNVVELLADHFDSVREITRASRSELTTISGIGDRRADRILHRHSQPLKQRLRETKGSTIPVIEDDEGVLRLPQEYESGDHKPKHGMVAPDS